MPSPFVVSDLPPLRELEARYIRHVVERSGGNKARAARTLGIERRTLYRKLARVRRVEAPNPRQLPLFGGAR